jgi:3-phenylpropionate/trans-cinnamate dioxygenase ferredoxin subunit
VSFEAVCTLGDLPLGRASRKVVGGVAMAVVRTTDAVYAVNDRCSHADVSLSEGEVEGCTLECWLHGSAFDLTTGAPQSPPASIPIPVYAVRVVGDDDTAVIEIDPTPIRITEEPR